MAACIIDIRIRSTTGATFIANRWVPGRARGVSIDGVPVSSRKPRRPLQARQVAAYVPPTPMVPTFWSV